MEEASSLLLLRRAALAQATLIGIVCGALLKFFHVQTAIAFTLGTYVAVCIAFVFAAYRDTASPKRLFFGSLSAQRLVILALLCGVLLPVSGAAFQAAIETALHIDVGPMLPNRPSLFFAFFALLVAPLAETIIFQFWLQTKLLASPIMAVFVTSLAFISIHFRLDLALVLAAFAFSTARQRFGSLGVAWLGHSFYNATLLVATLVWP